MGPKRPPIGLRASRLRLQCAEGAKKCLRIIHRCHFLNTSWLSWSLPQELLLGWPPGLLGRLLLAPTIWRSLASGWSPVAPAVHFGALPEPGRGVHFRWFAVAGGKPIRPNLCPVAPSWAHILHQVLWCIQGGGRVLLHFHLGGKPLEGVPRSAASHRLGINGSCQN